MAIREFVRQSWQQSPHLIQWTRVEILNLRNTNQLVPWVSYEIIDHVQGRLVAWTTVTLLATWTSELSHDARVNTTYDNTSWFWLYDIDTWVVYQLTDNRGNTVKWTAWIQVANFDRWNPAYTNCLVDNATRIVTIGNTATMLNVTVEKWAVLNTTWFTWSLQNSFFSNASFWIFTNADLIWRHSRIFLWAVFNASWYTWWWDNYYNEISWTNINISNSSSQVILRNNNMWLWSISHTWVTTWWLRITGNQMRSASINHAEWAWQLTLNNNRISWWSINHLTSGTVSLSSSTLLSTINKNSTNWWSVDITNSYIASPITQSSAWTISITRWRFENWWTVTMRPGALWTINLIDCTVSWGSNISKQPTSTAWNIFCNSVNLYTASIVRSFGTWNINITQSDFMEASSFIVNSWDRNYTLARITMKRFGGINCTWTWSWITDNIIEYSIERWAISISCSWAANVLQHWYITWFQWDLSLSWTTWWKEIRWVKLHDWRLIVNNNANASTMQYCTISDRWDLTRVNQPVWTIINYITIQSWWALIINKTWIWNITRVSINVWWTCSITWTTTSVDELIVETGTLNISWGSINNCSKKMESTWTITWWDQINTHHWSATNKTTAVANANRADYLGLTSTAPIL